MDEIRILLRVIGPTSGNCLRVAFCDDSQEDEAAIDIPSEQIPPHLRMPNSEFVAVMHLGRFIRVEPEGPAWLEIQQQIRSVLNADWDPIGVADSVKDEYDCYILSIYEMLQRDEPNEHIARHLLDIEAPFGMVAGRTKKLLAIANKLRQLNLPRVAVA